MVCSIISYNSIKRHKVCLDFVLYNNYFTYRVNFAFLRNIYKYISEPSCFLPNKDTLIPTAYTIARITNVASAKQCQFRCQQNPACHYFVLNERDPRKNMCYLKSKNAIAEINTRAQVTFGPKFCPSGGREKLKLLKTIFINNKLIWPILT